MRKTESLMDAECTDCGSAYIVGKAIQNYSIIHHRHAGANIGCNELTQMLRQAPRIVKLLI